MIVKVRYKTPLHLGRLHCTLCLKVGEPARPAISPIRVDGSDIGPEDQDPSGTRPHVRKCQGISRVDFTQNPASNVKGVLTDCINIIMLLSTSPTFAGAKLRLQHSVCDCRFWTGLGILIDALCTDLTFAFGPFLSSNLEKYLFILSNVTAMKRRSIAIRNNTLASED
jgi:hypothetical protein